MSIIQSNSDPFSGWQKMCLQFKSGESVTQLAFKLTAGMGFSVAVRTTDNNSARGIDSKTWETIKS